MIGVPSSLSCYGNVYTLYRIPKIIKLIVKNYSATAQWFANVEHLQKQAVENLKKVRMIPDVCKSG
jgi:valyl-tRNA synthetase